MTFEYYCKDCTIITEHIGKIGQAPEYVSCTMCGKKANRQFSIPQLIGTSVETPQYNPAFGQIVKNSKHAKELAKKRGMVEIGNEPVDKMLKSQDAHIESVIKRDYE